MPAARISAAVPLVDPRALAFNAAASTTSGWWI
jgi:hypothetical protein